jgi:hypothetical protein
MTKITKRVVDAAEAREKDYVIWDDELPGFAALVGHAKGSVTSKYIHTLDTALIMAAYTISGYIQGFLTASRSSKPPTRWTATHEKPPWPAS